MSCGVLAPPTLTGLRGFSFRVYKVPGYTSLWDSQVLGLSDARVKGLGFEVEDLGLRALGSDFRV